MSNKNLKNQSDTSQNQQKDSMLKSGTFDISTLFGKKVHDIPLSNDAKALADAIKEEKNIKNPAELAETLWIYRQEIIEDIRALMNDKKAEANIDKKEKDMLLNKIFEQEEIQEKIAIYKELLKNGSQTVEQELARHAREKNTLNGDYEAYHAKVALRDTHEENLNKILLEMYGRRGQPVKEHTLQKRRLYENKIEKEEQELKVLREKNPDATAYIGYEQILKYATELRDDGFIWTESRRGLLKKTMERALSQRPMVVFFGESGTGKTALSKAVAKEMTEQEIRRETGGRDMELRRILGSMQFVSEKTLDNEKAESYFLYGNLLRAMSGKDSSLDKTPRNKGGAYFDDEFNSRPPHVQKQLLKYIAEARPGKKMTIPGTGEEFIVQTDFLYIAAGNPAGEKYGTSEETPVEAYREFAGNVMNVPYLEQNKDNPELFEILLAASIDTRVMRINSFAKDELSPGFIPDKVKGVEELDTNPASGGIVWRFANCWKELFNAFSRKDTVLSKQNPGSQPDDFYLRKFVLDPGIVLGWLDDYKKHGSVQKSGFELYLKKRINEYMEDNTEMFGGEFPLIKQYFKHFGIDLDDLHQPKNIPERTVMTPKEIGYLLPNVPRKIEKIAPKPKDIIEILPDGTEVTYRKELPKEMEPAYLLNMVFERGDKTVWRLLGTLKKSDYAGEPVLFLQNTKNGKEFSMVQLSEFDKEYKLQERIESDIEKELRLEEQYNVSMRSMRRRRGKMRQEQSGKQVTVDEDVGLVREVASPEGYVMHTYEDIEGNSWPINYMEVARETQKALENPEIIKWVKRGFTQLVLEPILADINVQANNLASHYLELSEMGQLFRPDSFGAPGDVIQHTATTPVPKEDTYKMIYLTDELFKKDADGKRKNNETVKTDKNAYGIDYENLLYNQTGWKDNHSNAINPLKKDDRFVPLSQEKITKRTLIREAKRQRQDKKGIAGWRAYLVPDAINIPANYTEAEKAAKQRGEWGPLLAGLSPHQYAKALREPINEGLVGMHIDGVFALAASVADNSGMVIDDYLGNGKINYILGNIFNDSGRLPYCYWNEDGFRAGVSDVNPGYGYDYYGFRPAVRLF